MPSQQLSIANVEAKFAYWRKTKKGHPNIPKELCKQVKQLLRTHKHSIVLRQLGLSRKQAITKGLLPSSADVTTTKSRSKLCSSPTFIHIPTAQSSIHPSTIKAATLTLKRGDTQLTLDNLSSEQIHSIATMLLGQEACYK